MKTQKVNSLSKVITKGTNLTKQSKENKKTAKVEKPVSSYKLQLIAHKYNKNQMFSLSKVLSQIDTEAKENKDFFNSCNFDPTNLKPAFILSNCTKIKVKENQKYFNRDNEVYFKAIVKGQPTEVKKSLWTLWDIEQSIRFSAK